MTIANDARATIAALQKAHEASTQDRWQGCHDGECECGSIYATKQDFVIAVVNLNHNPEYGQTVPKETFTANAKFITLAHNALPDILAYIERLEGALAQIRDYDVAEHSKWGVETVEEQATAMHRMRRIARQALETE